MRKVESKTKHCILAEMERHKVRYNKERKNVAPLIHFYVLGQGRLFFGISLLRRGSSRGGGGGSLTNRKKWRITDRKVSFSRIMKISKQDTLLMTCS